MSEKISTPSRPAATEPDGNIDLSEKGRGPEGQPVTLDRRLFMQFMAFRNGNRDFLAQQFEKISAQAVLYQDLNDAQGIGVMAYCEDPGYIVDQLHPILNAPELQQMTFKEEFTMLGRTYAIGYEADLENVLINRPIERVCDPKTPWAVYYPLRRSGQFERQSREDQRKMLSEHGGIGHAYGKAGFATDIRLAGHGLNKDDNDFIVGLLGEKLFPLSALVQHMRRTRQTSEFIQKMGPFFVGRATWQPAYDASAELV
jgi:hypothetical protein